MKVWQKIIAIIAFVGILGVMGYTAIAGWGSGKQGAASNITLGLDLAGGVSVTYEAQGTVSAQDMSDVKYKMQQRVGDYDGANVYQEGTNRVTIEIPGADDATKILEELGKPGALYFIIQYCTDAEGNKVANYTYDSATYSYKLSRTLEEIEADGGIILGGSDIKDANGVYIENSKKEKEPVVDFVLKDEGATKFAEATKICYENGWSLGVYYDGVFISVPSVSNGAITGGQGQITGMSSIEAAQNLATYIRIGALPVELKQISAQVVGAQLGQDAIKTSMIAGVIGLALLFIFMIAYYRIPGVAACISLATYTFGMLLILNVFDLTLTLPGIAGIILGVGMAVDGNVVIYARIREELATGRPVRGAIKVGFQKALSAIVDGNVTTLIAAVILGIIGTGAIRGFALTLGIGIVLSLITSLLVARWALLILYHCGCNKVGMYGVNRYKKIFNFTAKRKICFAISGLLIATGVVFMVVNGASGKGAFNYDLEFTGGTSTTVTFEGSYDLDKVESDIVPVIKDATGVPTVQQQIVKGDDATKTQVIFKTAELSDEQRSALYEALSEKFGVDTSNQDDIYFTSISGSISNEMRRDAVIAIVVATFCMLIYIAVRFRDVRFAVSAILALVHDVLIVLGFYAISRTGVGNTFIACMLTIVGYSINATIVIFDRVRENLNVMTKATLSEVVNSSITTTLTRSINTSLTTFIMVLVLYILGVSAIKDFAAPIMVGIVIGGYSSVFISGSLWFVMKKAAYKRAVKKIQA